MALFALLVELHNWVQKSIDYIVCVYVNWSIFKTLILQIRVLWNEGCAQLKRKGYSFEMYNDIFVHRQTAHSLCSSLFSPASSLGLLGLEGLERLPVLN